MRLRITGKAANIPDPRGTLQIDFGADWGWRWGVQRPPSAGPFNGLGVRWASGTRIPAGSPLLDVQVA